MPKILEEEIYGKVATPKRKIIGEFIEKYITDIENCYKTNLTIVLITNFSCTVIEILLQKKILDSNSY